MDDPTRSVFPMVKKPAKYRPEITPDKYDRAMTPDMFQHDLQNSGFNTNFQDVLYKALQEHERQLAEHIRWVCNVLDITPEELGKRVVLERHYDNDTGIADGIIHEDHNSAQFNFRISYRLVPRKTDGS